MSTTGTMTTDTFPAYRLKSGVLKDHLKNTVFSTSPDREKIQVEVRDQMAWSSFTTRSGIPSLCTYLARQLIMPSQKSYNDLYKLTIPRALYQVGLRTTRLIAFPCFSKPF